MRFVHLDARVGLVLVNWSSAAAELALRLVKEYVLGLVLIRLMILRACLFHLW